MIISFVSEKKNDSRVNYIAEFMLNTLGYPYQLVSTHKNIPQGSLIIAYVDRLDGDSMNPEAHIRIFHSGLLHALDEFEKHIDLFSWQDLNIPILGSHWQPPSKTGWRQVRKSFYYANNKTSTWYIGFDLVTNIFYHLSRYEEKWRHFAEETATDYSTSILSRYQQLKVPVVDVLLDYLNQLIIKKAESINTPTIRILNWPRAEKFGVALTHDVDLTRGVGFTERLINTGAGVLQTLTGDAEKKRIMQDEMKNRDSLYWSYPEILSYYNEKGWSSTFFFLTRMFEGLHIRYNIFSTKFKKLLKELRENGHEIALHSSLKAFDKRGRYREEKERLEKVTADHCAGLRQHYLRAKYPRLWRIAGDAGFSYDSSLSYNFQAGFRAGTAHPFEAFDYSNDKPTGVVEFSLLCFEHNLPIEDGAQEVLDEIINQVARYNGLFVVLWHPSNFLQEPFRQVWDGMILSLQKHKIFVNSLEEHHKWFSERKAFSFNYSEGELTIKNNMLSNAFSVQLIGPAVVKSFSGIQLETQANKVITFQPKTKRVSLLISS